MCCVSETKTLKSAVFLTSISGQQITSYDVTRTDSVIVSCKNNGGDVSRYVTGIIQNLFVFFWFYINTLAVLQMINDLERCM